MTRRTEPLTDAQWDQQVRARLAACVPDLVPGSPAVGAITLLADDVWIVELAHGGRLIAKHQFYGLHTRDEPHDLLQVEFDALRYLRPRGCAVPVAFGIDRRRVLSSWDRFIVALPFGRGVFGWGDVNRHSSLGGGFGVGISRSDRGPVVCGE